MRKLLLIVLIFSGNFLFASTINKPMKSQSACLSKGTEMAGRYGFIENKGQIIDQNNNLNPSVLYLYNGNGLHVQLKQTGFSYEVWKVAKGVAGSQPLASGKINEHNATLPIANSHPDSYRELEANIGDSTFIHRIDISFVGVNQNAKIISREPASDYINYYTTGTSEAGITNVHHYKKVLYQNIYPNIDVEFVLNENKFKYNFIIHPGGNPNDIQLKFDGANSTSLTNDGHITIETSYGNIDESIPYSYQLDKSNQQQEIAASFTSNPQSPASNLYGIVVGKYDATKTLIIDPLPWGTYFGGVGSDIAYGTATDPSGNVLIVGSTGSYGFATSGAYQIANGGIQDAFVTKFNSSGSLLWATYYGGSGSEDGNGIATDITGCVFFIGTTKSSSGIASSGAYNSTYGGGSTYGDAFIVKLASSGARVWGTYFGGSADDLGNAINIDVSGNLLVIIQ
jgi:hypothetical protein